MRWYLLLGLVLCNVVWALNPIMGKILLQELSPLQMSWWRYASAFFIFGIYAAFKIRPIRPNFAEKKNWYWFAGAGFVTFFLSPFFQSRGLALSSPTANAIIVAVEPLSAALLAWIFLKEKILGKQWVGFSLAIIGFILLSQIGPSSFTSGLGETSLGNLFILAAIPAEAMFSVFCRKLSTVTNDGKIMLYSLAFGLIFLTFACLFVNNDIAFPHKWQSWGALLWYGPLGTAFGYLFWSYALRYTSVAAASITLFVQPLLGSFAGILWHGDRLSLSEGIGALLILAALLLDTLTHFSTSSVQKPPA